MYTILFLDWHYETYKSPTLIKKLSTCYLLYQRRRSSGCGKVIPECIVRLPAYDSCLPATSASVNRWNNIFLIPCLNPIVLLKSAAPASPTICTIFVGQSQYTFLCCLRPPLPHPWHVTLIGGGIRYRLGHMGAPSSRGSQNSRFCYTT